MSKSSVKSPDAFRTISEAADALELPQHVLRFWETRFSQIKPMKRSGGRRYYRPSDIALLRGIRHLLYDEGYTIKGVQRILREQGIGHVTGLVDEHVAPSTSLAANAPSGLPAAQQPLPTSQPLARPSLPEPTPQPSTPAPAAPVQHHTSGVVSAPPPPGVQDTPSLSDIHHHTGRAPALAATTQPTEAPGPHQSNGEAAHSAHKSVVAPSGGGLRFMPEFDPAPEGDRAEPDGVLQPLSTVQPTHEPAAGLQQGLSLSQPQIPPSIEAPASAAQLVAKPQPTLSQGNAELLASALSELIECKALLDQARPKTT